MSFDQLPAAVEKLQATVDALYDIVIEMKSGNNTSDILNVEEAAKFIDRSASAVRALVHRKQMPSYKKNGRVYFKRDELAQWMVEDPKERTAEVDVSQYMKRSR